MSEMIEWLREQRDAADARLREMEDADEPDDDAAWAYHRGRWSAFQKALFHAGSQE